MIEIEHLGTIVLATEAGDKLSFQAVSPTNTKPAEHCATFEIS